jgi:hypothetical protein
MLHLSLVRLSARYAWHVVVVSTALAIVGCDGSLSLTAVNETLAHEIELEAKLVSGEELRESLAPQNTPLRSARVPSSSGRYLIVVARNRSNLGVWGNVEVVLSDDRTYQFRVPHLEPVQETPVVFVAYVGSGWSDLGVRPCKWIRLHGK